MLALSEQDSRRLARHIVDALIVRLSDEDTVEKLTTVWGKHLDRWIGRGVRRFALHLLLIALVAGAIKFQAWNYVFK